MENQTELIKSKIDLVEFIGSYIPVKKAGRSYKANCPFHNEKSPSFVISPERQIWHCFGACHDGGDVIKFLMKWENITFYEALKELAVKAGVKLESVGFEDKEWKTKEVLMRINVLAADYFEYILHSTAYGKEALTYLEGRALHPKMIKTFKLGYAPQSWDSLLRFLKKKNYKEEDIFNAGLLSQSGSNHYYDRFRGRIMFPIKDIRGNIIGFSGRLLSSDPGAAKYVNTPETTIYHKRESLFGIHLAKDAIKKQDNVLLVEGEFDMILPYQHGVENVVAIKGSAVTKEQLGVLKRLTKKITLALDADAAGEDAVKRGIREAEEMEFDISVVTVENGKDPDEAVRNDHVAFKKSLQHAVPIYDFLITLAIKTHGDSSPYAKKQIGDDIVPYIGRIHNPIVQSYYIKKIAALLDVSDESVERLTRNSNRQKKPARPFVSAQASTPPDRRIMMERFLVSYILQSDNPYTVVDQAFEILSYEDFTVPALAKICAALTEYKKSHPQRFDIKEFVPTLAAELQPVCDEVYMYTGNDPDQQPDLARVANEIKKTSLKKRISDLLEQSDEPDKEKQIASLSEMLREVEKRASSV